jgi:hypothetical protein
MLHLYADTKVDTFLFSNTQLRQGALGASTNCFRLSNHSKEVIIYHVLTIYTKNTFAWSRIQMVVFRWLKWN